MKKIDWKSFKRHIMTGISFMIPVVVGAGLCQALGIIIGGANVGEATGTIAYYIYKVGNLCMSTMLIPVVCAGISYSIADKPGIAPGLICGLISADIKAGFLGGLIAGFLVGFVVNWMKKHIKLPESVSGMMPVLIIPFFSSLVCGLLMYTVIGQPVAWIMGLLTNFLTHLSTGSKFIYGAILGFCSGTDFGGPVNKTISMYSTACLADGIFEPKSPHFLAGMIAPFGVLIAWGLSKLFRKPIWTNNEKESLKACLPMGCCMITECVIPLWMNDFWRIMVSSQIASAIAGGLSMVWGVGVPVAHGGLFVVPVMIHPVKFLICLAIGATICGVLIFVLKKRLTPEQVINGIDYTEDKSKDTVADVQIQF